MENEIKGLIVDVKGTVDETKSAVTEIEKRLEAVEIAQARPAVARGVAADIDETKSLFVDWIKNPSNETAKAAYLAKAAVTVAGLPNAAPRVVSNDIVAAARGESAIAALAKHVEVDTPDFAQLITSGVTYSLVGESTTRPDNDADYGVKKPINTEVSSVITFTSQSLEDFGFDALKDCQDHFAADFASAMSQYYINGTGTGVQPQGLLTGGVEVEGALSADSVLSLMAKVNASDRRNGVFIMSNGAWDTISKAKANGQYIADIKDGVDLIRGKTVYVDDFMPEDTPVVFGNFKRAFLTATRKQGVQILVNPYKNNGFVEISARLRFGSVVLHDSAYAKLVLA